MYDEDDHEEHHEMRDQPHTAGHPWKARFIVGLIMIILSFVGLVLSDIWQNGAWNYWRVVAPVFAIMCIWLSWYLRKKQHSFSFTKLWHEILHWVALAMAVFLFSLFVGTGLMGRFEAGLAVLTVLALTLFIGGIYIEPSFMLIGIVLGLFAAGAAYMAAYLYSVMLPVTLVAVGILFLFVYFKRKKRHPH